MSDFALYAVLANLPDVDLLIGLLLKGDAQAYHGGVTHSIFFAVVMGLVASLILRRRFAIRWSLFVFSLAVASHVLVDSFTGTHIGVHSTRGYALFWPFSQTVWPMPVTLFPGVQHDTLARLLSAHNLAVIGYEILIFVPVIALLWLIMPGCSRPACSKSECVGRFSLGKHQ
jgi:membrane-bound metal-dependent hydrolase YbcI (DUF457 family)